MEAASFWAKREFATAEEVEGGMEEEEEVRRNLGREMWGFGLG